MERIVVAALAFSLLAGVPNVGLAAETKLVAKLQAQNSSQNGGVRLTQQGSALLVEVHLSSAGKAEPASIYHGSCSKVGALAHSLGAVTGGKLTTTLAGLQLSTLRSGTFALVIHASSADMKRYVSCGDIGRGAHLMQDTEFNGFGGRIGQ